MSRKECFEKVSKLLPSEEIRFRINDTEQKELLKPGAFLNLSNRNDVTGRNKLKANVQIVTEIPSDSEEMKTIYPEFKSNWDAKRCGEITSDGNYIAMVQRVSADIATVLISYGLTAVDNIEKMSVGVSDKSGLRAKNIRGGLTMCSFGRDCFLTAKPLSGNEPGKERCFWIVDGINGYRTVLGKRSEYMNAAPENSGDDDVFVITGRVSAADLEKMKVKYEVRIGELSVMSIEKVPAAKPFQESYFNDEYDSFFDTWRKYSRIEFEAAEEEREKIGFLRYSGLQKLSPTMLRVRIDMPELVNDFRNSMSEYGFVSDRLFSVSLVPDTESIQRSIRGRILEINDTEAVIETDFEYRQDFSNTGIIRADITGSEKSFERREKAFERIARRKSGKPNLAALIRGHRETPGCGRYPAWTPGKNVMKVFRNGPNASQLQALKTAFNTPDIAIIQGPPGTGKSTVIRAIIVALSEEEEGEKLSYAKNLVTAYQRDATSNLSDGMKVYGLPVPVYAGENDETARRNYEKSIDEWLEDKRKKFEQRNQRLAADTEASERRRLARKIDRWRSEYRAESAGIEQNLMIIELLQNPGFQKYLSAQLRMKIFDLASDINFDAGKRDVFMSYINSLPTCIESMEDEGAERAESILCLLKNDLSMPASARQNVNGLSKLYRENPVSFKKITRGIDKLSISLNMQPNRIIDRKINEAIAELIEETASYLESECISDENTVLLDYYDALKGNNPLARDDLSFCSTVISATHQKSVSKEIEEAKKEGKRRRNETDEFDLIYDNVLIDEAARSSPPDLLIPMSCAVKRIIMVGDQKQLPQFINDEAAIKASGGDKNSAEMNLLKQSLFAYLIENAKKLTERDLVPRFIRLDTQYRMPETLGNFVSQQFYEGGLKYGGGNHEQSLPVIGGLHMGWMTVGIEEGAEEFVRGSYCRPAEAAKISRLLEKLVSDEKGKKYSYGVITFYSRQKEVIEKELSGLIQKGIEIEVGTVDSMQGKEFDIVFLSMVRSRSRTVRNVSNPFGFVTNRNRQCVALSRAKKCMIIAGDPDMIERYKDNSLIEPVCEFYKICREGSGKENSHAAVIH